MTKADRDAYLRSCYQHENTFNRDMPIYGVICVVVLCILDLVLTLIKICQGPFVDANPIAQFMIQNGFYATLIACKLFALVFFAWVCTRNRHLLVTKVGVGVCVLAYLLLTFHWTIVF